LRRQPAIERCKLRIEVRDGVKLLAPSVVIAPVEASHLTGKRIFILLPRKGVRGFFSFSLSLSLSLRKHKDSFRDSFRDSFSDP
jgi:hypothetical protein